MDIKTQFFKAFHIFVSVVLIILLSACGYFMYPERRGQKPIGRIDPAVATLDALGLLLFVIPGVIAFAVDITNGTLYFPGGRSHSSGSTGTEHMTVIRVNPAELNEKVIQEIVKKHAGVSTRADLRNVEIYELNRSENIEAKLIEIEKSGYKVGFHDLFNSIKGNEKTGEKDSCPFLLGISSSLARGTA